jgi:hypothetical protein
LILTSPIAPRTPAGVRFFWWVHFGVAESSTTTEFVDD